MSNVSGQGAGTARQPQRTINQEFQVHRLNSAGLEQAEQISTWFDNLLTQVKAQIPEGRELSLVKTHMELACTYAKKAISKNPENQL